MNFISRFFKKQTPKERFSPCDTRDINRTPRNSVRTTSSTGYSGGAKIPFGISGDGWGRITNSRQMLINARNATHDSVEAKSIVETYADTVVDTGISIQPSINSSLLGITEEDAEVWNTRIAEKFDLYLNSKKCHRSRMLTGYQAQHLFQKALFTDNDSFVRFYFENERDTSSPVSFEFIDPLQIVGTGAISTSGAVNIYDGIERDSRGREISYRIQRLKADGTFEDVNVPAKKNGRYFMVHGFVPDQIGQLRGYSKIGHLLQEFQNLTDFKLSHIQKAIAQASISIAVENDGDNDPGDPFEGLVDTPAGTRQGTRTVTTQNGDVTETYTEEIEINKVAGFSTIGNALNIVNLKSKDKVKPIGNTAPVTNYDVFVNSFFTNLAASSGAPVEIVRKSFNANYSASQASFILFYRIAEIYRMKIDTDFLSPLYENWLAEEIASGREKCPGWSDPLIRSAWLNHTLVAQQKPNIDPVKTARANMLNLEMSATTLDRVAQETNGSNGKSNRMSNRRQFAEIPFPYWTPAAIADIMNEPEEPEVQNSNSTVNNGNDQGN